MGAAGVKDEANPRISSRTTSVAGLHVCLQYFSRFSASSDAKLIVIRLTAHFLFIILPEIKQIKKRSNLLS